MPIRCSSDTYRDIRNQLWPDQVKLRKLSDLRKYSITDIKNQPVVAPTGPIYNVASDKNIVPSSDVPNEDVNEDLCEIPWINEMRRMTVNSDPLSASHLDRLQRVAARHNNLPEDYFSQLKTKNSRTRTNSENQLCEIIEENKSSDTDDDEDDLPETTKLLLLRSKKLASTVTKNKPKVTLKYSRSFPELKTLEEIYTPNDEKKGKKKVKVAVNNSTSNSRRKVSVGGTIPPTRRESLGARCVKTATQLTNGGTRYNASSNRRGSIGNLEPKSTSRKTSIGTVHRKMSVVSRDVPAIPQLVNNASNKVTSTRKVSMGSKNIDASSRKGSSSVKDLKASIQKFNSERGDLKTPVRNGKVEGKTLVRKKSVTSMNEELKLPKTALSHVKRR